MGMVGHRDEKEAVGTAQRCELRQQREGVLTADSSRSRPKGVVHQDISAVGELGARVVEHCPWLIAAPVMCVDRPTHEL
jgi:hypothetical protein